MQDRSDRAGGLLERLRFDNSFVRSLPADPETKNFRRQVHAACYSRVEPEPVAAPRLIGWSSELAAALALPESIEGAAPLTGLLAGNELSPALDPYAACYGGHQFGSWAGQLGDGRAITLGELLGEHGRRWELQLKGAGATPYSRMGDGRAVLRSSVREFLCSEAMHHLGVPTTRALSLAETGEKVERDMFYDGHPRMEPGAVVCRVAPSFLRFGNFEIFAARDDVETLRRLADYAIATHFPELGEPGEATYVAWFREVCGRTAEMIAHWMRVGFVHGVMNTDNMSILGLTIDYGPYGWVENYDPDWTPNTSDAATRRYRFGNQPAIAAWNLVRFAHAVYPLIGRVEPLEEALDAYAETLAERSMESFAAKLGLQAPEPGAAEDPEQPGSVPWLIDTGFALLQAHPTDMTIFFRALADVPTDPDVGDAETLAPLRDAYYDLEGLPPALRERTVHWLRALAARVRAQGLAPAERRERMRTANPRYVLRNYLAQLAIDAAEAGDPSKIDELLTVLRRPYDDQPGREHLADKRPAWADDRPGCSMLSCSS